MFSAIFCTALGVFTVAVFVSILIDRTPESEFKFREYANAEFSYRWF